MRRLLAVLVPLGTLILLTFTVYLSPSWLEMLRLKGFDLLHERYPRAYDTASPVRIIDIDEESLRRLGQWPWPRNIMASLLDRLYAGGVGAVGLDIVFAEPDRTSPALFLRQWKQNTPQWQALMESAADFDAMFAKALAAGPSITGFVLTPDGKDAPLLKKDFILIGNDPSDVLENFSGAVVSLPSLTEAASGNGALNSLPDRDGIIRRIPLVFRQGEQLYPSLVAELLRVGQRAGSPQIKTVGSGGATGEADVGMGNNILSVRIGRITIPTNKTGDFFIHYTPHQPERYISAWRIFSGDYDASQLEGMIVLIGTSAAGLKDIRATPLEPLTSGVEIHAQAIEQVLEGNFLSRPDWLQGVEAGVLFGLGLLLILCMHYLSAFWGAAFCLTMLGAGIAGGAYAFRAHHLMVDTATPALCLLIVYMLESLRRYIITERERRDIRNAFAHYMSPALVEKLAQHPEALKLGGEMRDMTILFSDIRGFTTLSELYDAEELTRFLNRYLTPMTDVILSHSGTIDKYMGDAIMAFWNAPLDTPDHAALACRAALEMLKAQEALNTRRQQEAAEAGTRFLPVQIGIGLNSGPCCVGNMGSDQRFDYSVLGDDVNLASRLEGQSKYYGVTVILGERTQAQVPHFATLELDLIRVKGKTEAVRIFSLLGDEAVAATPGFATLRHAHDAMLAAYRAQDWDAALRHLEEAEAQGVVGTLPMQGFYALCRERIAAFKKTPPAEDWGGVYEAKTK
jgi:adenylate cyclase